MPPQYCCFCSNRTGAQIIALLGVIQAVLWLVLGITGATVGQLSWGALPIFIAAILALAGALCLFIGARNGKPSYILFWIILALISLVFYVVNIVVPASKHEMQWVPFAISIALQVWFLLVAIGARHEILGTEPSGYIV